MTEGSYLLRFQTFRRSHAYIYLACGYSSTAVMMSMAMFQPILPFYLRDILNCTQPNVTNASDVTVTSDVTSDVTPDGKSPSDVTSCSNGTWLKGEVSRQIGIISGSGSIMMLIFCLLSGFLIHRFPLRPNYYASYVANLLCPILAFFARDIATMCFASGFAAIGQSYSFVCYASTFSEFAENDKQLTRFHGAFRIFNGLGYVIGYSAASASYQFFGHKVTFGICTGLVFVDIFFRMCLVMKKEGKKRKIPEETGETMLKEVEVGNNHHTSLPIETVKEESTSESWKTQLKLLTNPFVIMVTTHVVINYVATSIFWGTAPNFVATELGAEQWQTGLMMGVGTAIDLFFQVIAAVSIHTQNRRVVAIVVGNVLLACGYFWYPFVRTVWAALPPDALFRTSRDLVVLLLTTMYPYICDCAGVHDKRFVYAVCATACSLGLVIGYYSSGVLVVALGFRNLYLTLGTCCLISALSCLAFLRIKSKKPSAVETNISVSIGDLGRPDLGLAELTASGISIRKSNISLNKIA